MKWIIHLLVSVIVFGAVYMTLDYAYGAPAENQFLVFVAVIAAYTLGVLSNVYLQYFDRKKRT